MSRSLHHIRLIMTWPLGNSILSGDFSKLLDPFYVSGCQTAIRWRGSERGEGVAFRAFFVGFSTKARGFAFHLSWCLHLVCGRPTETEFLWPSLFRCGRAGIEVCRRYKILIVDFEFEITILAHVDMSGVCRVAFSIPESADPCLYGVLQVSSFCKSPILFCFTRESYCSAMYIVLLVFGAEDKHLLVLLSWERQVHL
jgi:hypothetical protein